MKKPLAEKSGHSIVGTVHPEKSLSASAPSSSFNPAKIDCKEDQEEEEAKRGGIGFSFYPEGVTTRLPVKVAEKSTNIYLFVEAGKS